MRLSLVATIPSTGATNRVWENQRRAVCLVLFVAWTAAQDLLLQAKHLFVAAIVARRRVADAISAVLRRRSAGGTNTGAADAPGAWGTWNGRRGQLLPPARCFV
jgi:hypothetical protein